MDEKESNSVNNFVPTDRTQVHRIPKRGIYEKKEIYRILDEGLVCHVGFIANGMPVVIPTGYGRRGDTLYVHGSSASRMLRALGRGADVCVTVTLLDGLVLARSAFHHSMNYRSVVIFGRSTIVDDPATKLEVLEVFTNHIAPGRWKDVRHPTDKELQATTVLAMPLNEVSAKVRTGPPIDDGEDYFLPIWAGVLPMKLTPGSALPDERLPKGIAIPEYIVNYTREEP